MDFPISSQFSNIVPPEFDPMVDYGSLFEENMCMLDGFHETPLNQQQLKEAYNNAWLSLRALKAKWQYYQRHASLAIPVTEVFPTSRSLPLWDNFNMTAKYQRMYAYVLRFPDAGGDQCLLIQESMIIEWPNLFHPYDAEDSDGVMVDRAPLIFISRNNKSTRVRRRHPSVQLSILALNQNTAPAVVQCRARIVTESVNRREMETYGKWRPVGKLMNVKREGGEKQLPTFPYEEQNEALVANCGQQQMSPLQFNSNGTLTVQYSEIGVDAAGNRAASSLVRYRIEMYCRLRFANGAEIENTVLSQPFLIAANKEQNTVVLGDLTWEILTTKPISQPISPHLQTVRWCDLRNFLRHSVQCQLPGARALDAEEILHIQCMLFLPLAAGETDLRRFECYWFGNEQNVADKEGIKKLKYRLLRENVSDYVEVEERQFLKNKCISMKDGRTILLHSVWEWLCEAIEMIVDGDPARLICEDLSPQTSATKKKKSSMMLKLFNEKLITMSSRDRVWKVYKSLYRFDEKRKRWPTKAMLIHFCDEIAGHLTIHYSNSRSDEKPTFGNLSAVQIKAYDRGLVGMLMQAAWPSQFDRLVKFDSDRDVRRKYGKEGATFPVKKRVFIGFQPKMPVSPHGSDPLQHDATFGPVSSVARPVITGDISAFMVGPSHRGETSNFVARPEFMPPFLNTASHSSSDRTPPDPHQKQSGAAGGAVAHTSINLFTDTKDGIRINHNINNELNYGVNFNNSALK